MTHPLTVRPQIDQHLLAELPRFFQNRDAMYRELIQNALRAGAKTLDVTQAGRLLSFKDDGPGLADPQLLLTVARSGWNHTVRDPAGMGVLSTLNPEWVESVTFRSREWVFTLTPDDFQHARPIQVEQAEPSSGFTVILAFHPTHTRTEKEERDALARVRALANLTLTFQGETLAPEPLRGHHFTLPQGELYLHNAYGQSSCYWEGFPVHDTLADPLKSSTTSALLRTVLSESRLTFIPHPDSGVLPKLPDRNAMLHNDAWHAASDEAARCLHDWAVRQLPPLDLNALVFDLTVPELRKAIFSPPAGPVRWKFLLAHLTDLGYQITDTYDAKTQAYFAEDSHDDETESLHTYAFVPAVQDPQLDDAQISACALLAPHVTGLPYTPSFTGLPHALHLQPAHAPHFPASTTDGLQLCRELRYGPTDLPWFIQDSLVLLRGTPEEAEATLRAHQADIGAAALHAFTENGEIRSTLDIWEAETITGDQIGDFLLRALIETYFPQRKAATSRRDALRTQIAHRMTLLQALNHLPEYAAQAEPLHRDVQQDAERLEAEVHALTQQHRLP